MVNNMSPNEDRNFEQIFIISILVLVFVTISLAFLLWNWVGPHDHGDPGIKYDITLKQQNQTENNDYVLLINKSDPLKECPIEDARFTLFSYDRHLLGYDHHPVSEITNKTIDNETFIVFQDNDTDGKLSTGDYFIIKSINHLDDDGNPSPGYAESGCYFELRADKRYMDEIQLK